MLGNKGGLFQVVISSYDYRVTNFHLKNWTQGTKKVEELMEQFKLNPDALDYSLDIDFINKITSEISLLDKFSLSSPKVWVGTSIFKPLPPPLL